MFQSSSHHQPGQYSINEGHNPAISSMAAKPPGSNMLDEWNKKNVFFFFDKGISESYVWLIAGG